VESLAKKYDEKYRAAADVNTQLAAGEAAYREIQERKTDIFNALFKMEQGGNTNSLLQSRVNRISTDLDELRKALNERAKHLGMEVKEKPAIETPFGWQPGIQEKAALWDEDWEKFNEEGFTAVQDFMEETTGGTVIAASSVRPSDHASWAAQGERTFEKGTEFSMSTSVENKVELPQEDSVSVPKQVPADLQSTEASVSNGDDSEINKVSGFSLLPDNKTMPTLTANVSKASERYAGVVDSQEFGGDVLNCPTSMSSVTNSSEQGQISLKLRVSDWAFGNEEEADSRMHSSWGLQKNPAMAPINTRGIVQGATHPAKVAAFHGFTGGSLDVGSPQTSSIDETSSPARVFEQNGNSYFDSFSPLAMSKDSRVSLFSGGNTAQSTSLFTSGPGPTKRDDDFGGNFLHFDTFGPGSPVVPPRVSGASEDQATTGSFLNRFDSFNTVRTNKAHTNSFHSDDESDLFAGTLSFGATNQDNSDGWKAF
jgi:epidermal growth factor receptor substrate 15